VPDSRAGRLPARGYPAIKYHAGRQVKGGLWTPAASAPATPPGPGA